MHFVSERGEKKTREQHFSAVVNNNFAEKNTTFWLQYSQRHRYFIKNVACFISTDEKFYLHAERSFSREREIEKNTRKFLIIYWSGSGFALFCIYSKEHFRFRQMMLRNKWCSWKKMTMKQELELKLRWNFFHITYCHQALGENPFIPVDNLAAFLYNLH